MLEILATTRFSLGSIIVIYFMLFVLIKITEYLYMKHVDCPSVNIQNGFSHVTYVIGKIGFGLCCLIVVVHIAFTFVSSIF